jgi:hypothetical protein
LAFDEWQLALGNLAARVEGEMPAIDNVTLH